MKKNKLMQIFLLVMLLLNTVLPSLATTVSAAGITKNEQAKAGTGTISAVFFEDLNNNEQQDPSEPGVGGIELTLFDATANKKLGTTTTDSSGRYTFSNLPAGKYYLKIGEIPQGYRWFGQGPLGFGGGSTRYFDLAEGQTESGAYMTLYPTTASMKGIAYSDKNKNGQKDSDEVGIAGLETSIFKVGSSTPVQTTTTDGQGEYHFSKLEPNTPYSVEIKFPSDYEVTSKSYFIGSGKSEPISLSEEQMLENVNLGLYKAVPVGSISVNPTVLEKFVGESGTLVTTVLPIDATDKSVTYSSGDTTVMTVDSNGNWVAKKAGTTTIKVTSNEDKSKFAYVTVTVKEKYNPTISGQIQNETGSGFSGISVELREPGSGKLIQQTTSSIDGSYSFTGLTNNVNYYIKVMIPKDYQVKFGYGIFDTAGTSGYFKLEESNKSNITGVNLQLEPKTVLPESIKVSPKVIDTVVNETGQLTVEFFPTNTTNKDLTYKVSNVDIISVDANGKWTAKKSGKTTITVISASGAQDIVEVTVRSLTDSYIGGKIVDPNGKAVNGVELLIYSWDGKLVGQKTTDGTGAYRFDNLEAKHYYLQLKFPKEYEFVSSNKNYFWGNSTGYLHVDGMNSIGDVDAVIRLANPKESSLSGTIYDQTNNGIGFSGVEIQLVNADTGQVTKAITNTNGTYSFSNLEKSNYYLKIIAPVNYEFASSNVFYYDLLTGYIAVDGVAKQTGFDASLKVITPKNNSSIKGVITNQETGLGFPGVQLNLYSQDNSQKGSAVTATDGSYNFIGLTPGDYYVKLVFPVDYQLSHSNIFGSDGTSGYLALDGTNQLTDRNATLKKIAIEAESITVEPKELNQLIGDTGKLTVTFQPSNTTDKNVNFTSKNPNVITIDKDGNWIATGVGTTTIEVTTSNGKKETVKVTVKSKQESSISGKITNHSTGLGFEEISMKLYTSDGKLVSEAITDVNGYYSFEGLSKNDYYVILGVPEGQVMFTSNTFGADGVSGFYPIDGSNKMTDRNATLKPKDIPAVGITVEPKELNQFVGDTGKLAITFQPGSTTDKSLNFVSGKPEIMTIDKDGNWIATGVGTTTIEVTTSNGKKATVKVTVKSKQESSISGVITNHSTGLGLSEITLKLYTFDGKLASEVITDMDGQYSFVELSKSDYYIVLSVPEGQEMFYSNTFGSDGVSGFYAIDGSNKVTDRNATLKSKDIPAIGITVEPKELNQVVGDTGKLAVTFQPGSTTDKSLNFVSEDPTVMTIDKDGNWIATGVGTTTITVTTSNGKTATVKVTVTAKEIPAESITVEPKELNQIVGDTGKLAITFQPENTTDKSLNFVSEDSKVMTIDKDGNWIATGVGTTTITVTTSNGKTTTVAVTVKAKQESSISGIVTRQSTGAGIGGVTLTLYTFDSKPYGEVTTNAKGEYIFTNLPASEYYIVLSIPDGQEIAQSDTFGSDGVSGFYTVDGSNKLVEKNATLKTKDVLAESITAEPKELNQVVGDTGKLTITFQPSNTADKSLNFVSEDPTVMTIDKDGNWIATGVGTTIITVTTSNGKKTTVKVTVKAKEIPAESITAEPKELNQIVGDTGKLAITFQPGNTTDKSLNFVSEDPTVMTIDKAGNWIATGVGTTTIIVTTSNGKKTTVKVTVKAKEIPAESITAEPKELNQIVGDTGKLAITFQPSNTTDKSLNFVSQHPEIMTIDSEGNWVARAEGTTVITVTTSNGKLTHVFVTVKAKNVPAESITVEPKELNQFVGDT
ncbi:carboxypeptidase regulatory-like domain-containing protein, partial [Carnobacterium divergens]